MSLFPRFALLQDVTELKPVVLVTLVYFCMWYSFLFGQSYLKVWLFNKSQGSSGFKYSHMKYATPEAAAVKYQYSGEGGMLTLTADRTVGNTLEQAPPFLLGLWLHAVLVEGGPTRAFWMAWIYMCSRVVYPVCFYVGHPWLQVSTVPGYCVIMIQLLIVGGSAFGF